MTTILAIQGDDYALICSDSRISTMDSGGFASQITTLGSGSAKVAENGKYLLGAAGDMRAINIIHHVLVPPPPTPGLDPPPPPPPATTKAETILVPGCVVNVPDDV